MKLGFVVDVLTIFVSSINLVDATEFEGPQSIGELVSRAFPNGNAPEFTALPSTPQIAIANNDSAILKIMDLKVSDLPMKPGYVTFKLHHFLSQDVPAKSQMEVVSFNGDEEASEATVDICPYLGFANLHCPLKANKRDEVMQQVLQVPDLVEQGRFSFVAKVTAPSGALIAHIAAIIDIVQDGSRAGHSITSTSGHDEL